MIAKRWRAWVKWRRVWGVVSQLKQRGIIRVGIPWPNNDAHSRSQHIAEREVSTCISKLLSRVKYNSQHSIPGKWRTTCNRFYTLLESVSRLLRSFGEPIHPTSTCNHSPDTGMSSSFALNTRSLALLKTHCAVLAGQDIRFVRFLWRDVQKDLSLLEHPWRVARITNRF